jgi:DNA-binding winged helix-turn-helix (wHTH) protein
MKQFAPFRIDTVNQCLWRRSDKGTEERVLLAPTAFSVLLHLVDHAGRLVTHNELLESVWHGTHIQPQAVKRQILAIRTALGDEAKAPRFIETLPRRGYRFIAPVQDSPSISDNSVATEPHGKLVGRDRVLSVLHSRLESALEGNRKIVFVTGEPGIGKTSVVSEFERRIAARPIRISRGQCVEGFGGKEAYYPVLEALSKLCRQPAGGGVIQVLATEAPTWLVQLPAILKREQREALIREILGATRERMLREIGEALETLTAGNPLLLVLEDLHWVDHSTVDFISALARGRASAKLMLIGTFRPSDLTLSNHPLRRVKQELQLHGLCDEIALEPLAESDVAEYLNEKSSEPGLSDGLAALLYRHSEGNPLFMIAALDHLSEQGLISRKNGVWESKLPIDEIDLEMPDNLRQMIESQIERLGKEEQRALEVASVAGVKFSSSVAAAAANIEQARFEDICEGLSRRHLMVHSVGSHQLANATISERYQFVHTLYREVFYRRQAITSRLSLHQRIGERLEELFSGRLHEVASELAHHFEQSRQWAKAVRYLYLVAENAGGRYAHGEAAAILQDALKLAGKVPEEQRASLEVHILTTLADIYLVSFDMRVVETCEVLAARAADYGLIDVEIRALIEMVYPLSWVSAERSLEVIQRALELGKRQTDPLVRARTRASCLARRIWVGGWDAYDADECRRAIAEIRQGGDPHVLAWHLLDYNFVDWVSSEYREAKRDAEESLAVVRGQAEENPYLSPSYWLSQIILPWSRLFLGEWGEMLREIKEAIKIADRNGDPNRANTFRLYQAWLHCQAMDFVGVVEICNLVRPTVCVLHGSAWRRICLILTATAQTALGNYEHAHRDLLAVADEMGRQTVIHDWYSRMGLESGFTEFYLANGDRTQAQAHAAELLRLTQATEERTWRAWAWEANARVNLAGLDFERARDCITTALLEIEGRELPLAAWRVHATGAEISEQMGNSGLGEHHRQLSRATILRIANSLPSEEPLRQTFLSAPPVRSVLETFFGR